MTTREQIEGIIKDLWTRPEIAVEEIISLHRTFLKERIERVKEMENTKIAGEGLLSENSPEIYGNQRMLAYKKGYYRALSDILSNDEKLLEELNKGV